MSVKKLLAITILCAAALCSGTLITASAETQTGITIPEDFVVEFALDNVDYYAVGDGQFAFAEGNLIYIYTVNEDRSEGDSYNGGDITVYEHTASILALEYFNDYLYFSDGTSAYLYLSGEITDAPNISFTAYDDSKVRYEGTLIYYIYDYELNAYNLQTKEAFTYDEANYSKLSYINGRYYVLKDSTLCIISRGVLRELSFTYDDYTIGTVATNGAAETLGQSDTIQVAEVCEGAFIIRVDEDYLGETNFSVLNVSFASEVIAAQVLYMPEGGNAALIAAGTKTYLTLKSNLTVYNYSASSIASGTGSYYLLDDATVYSIPYESEYTKIGELDKDTIVTVTGYISDDAFDYDYYKVEYTDGGVTVSGYMISGLLTPYTFANDNYEEAEILGGDQADDNNIFTIALVMIIVVLVLIAVAYVTLVYTSDKKKRYYRK